MGICRTTIVVLVIFCFQNLSCVAGGNGLSYSSTTIELGAVPLNMDVSTTFTVTNMGNMTIEILGVKTSCSGCSAKIVGPTSLKKGDSTKVVASPKTGKLGARSFTILLETSPKEVDRASLTLNMDVQPLVYCVPDKIKLEPGPVDEGINGKFLLRIIRQDNNVQNFGKSKSGGFCVQIHHPDKDEKRLEGWPRVSAYYQEYIVEYNWTRVLTPGTFTGNIILETKYPKIPRISVPVVKKIIQ
jgi:hypothetical protein